MVGVEGPVDSVGAPRIRAGQPYHGRSFATGKGAQQLTAQQFPRQHIRTHEGAQTGKEEGVFQTRQYFTLIYNNNTGLPTGELCPRIVSPGHTKCIVAMVRNRQNVTSVEK